MKSNKKPDTGEPPKGPPPPPMAVDGDGRLTREDLESIFGVPAHILDEVARFNAPYEAAKRDILEAMRQHLRGVLNEYAKNKNSVAGSNPAGGD